ncbi:MAG: MFS transporter [Gammaproteobacteria bacterium]|nr:MFS transporter [Gammaproteobacteria bacterium]
MNNIVMKNDISKNAALKFIVMIGIVSFFADITYEGARSIAGPFLAMLGAKAVVVGFVAGFGELVGYGLRMVSGYLADRTARYWLITMIGYACNLLVVPLLALAGHWWVAATLLMVERMGKAIRVPARDAMLSHAGQITGMGWGFGLHQALDSAGGMLGPLIVACVLYYKNSYQYTFAILLIPALLALMTLVCARWLYPNPQALQAGKESLRTKPNMKRSFWLYIIGASFVAAGYADFPLMAYHFGKVGTMPMIWIPISYSLAMGVSIITAPLLGALYDRYGFSILIYATLLSCFFAPLVFLGTYPMALLGMMLWGIGMGAHESLMRAIIANMTPIEKRGAAYGIFNMIYGISWFLGSVIMGALYDLSIPFLVIFSLAIQLGAIPLLLLVIQKRGSA